MTNYRQWKICALFYVDNIEHMFYNIPVMYDNFRKGGEGMGISMPCLSRADMEQIAKPIVEEYKRLRVPKHHLCYHVDPTQLASLQGFRISYHPLTQDGSILGQTASVPLWTTVIDPHAGEMYWFFGREDNSDRREITKQSSPRGAQKFYHRPRVGPSNHQSELSRYVWYAV